MTQTDLIANLQAALAQVQNDIAALPSISEGTVDQLTDLSNDIATAQGYATTALTAYDQITTQFGQGGLYVSGTNPVAMIGNLVTLQTAAQALASTFDLSNKLARLGRNVAAVAAGGA